jgi:SAM-dependent methyltransferase
MISWRSFKNFIDEYEPFPFEYFLGQDWHHLQRSARRFHHLLNRLMGIIGEKSLICDLGAFPGTFLRVLRHYLEDQRPHLAAAGLLINPDFRDAMNNLDIRILEVNLDPAHDGRAAGVEDPEYNLPGEREHHDIVIATEIFEHMVNPSHLVKVAFDILKPGGRLLLTTPNLALLRGRSALLRGRSPNPPLSEYILGDSKGRWRPHFRVFTMAEVAEVLERGGFTILEREYLDLRYRRTNPLKNIFYSIPSLREDIMILASKPLM